MAVLVFIKSSRINDYYDLTKKTVAVGRDDTCEICLGDGSVSRRHALIQHENGAFWLKDLGSKNGTRRNQETIDRILLQNGDRLSFGNINAIFYLDPPTETAIAPHVSEETYLFQTDTLTAEQERLHFLYDLAANAATMNQPRALAPLVLEAMGEQLGAEHTYFGLVENDTLTQGFFRSFTGETEPFLLSRTILTKVIKSRKALLLQNAALESTLQDKTSVINTRTKSVACVPLGVGERLSGILYADTRSLVKAFTKNDLAFMAAIGAILGSLLLQWRTIVDLRSANLELQDRLDGYRLIGSSPRLTETRETLEKFARKGESSVLINGESGTGKELAARMIHLLSNRANRPFNAVNCAALPKDLIEDELFGHAKGAFTSANHDRHGLFQMTDGGSLFLDEIGEMPLAMQAKLLRVLETGEVRPIGDDKTVRVSVRIIAATNRDLPQMLREGTFRQDLFYRLHVLSLRLPALREHADDIPELSDYFLRELRGKVSTRVTGFSVEALAAMSRYAWPGNVRELKNVIERALYLADDSLIEPAHLLLAGDDETPDVESGSEDHYALKQDGPLEKEIEQLERARILAALGKYHWHKSNTAAELGITRKTLAAKIKKYTL
ncbi:MAG: sigma 54-interacting transcriptional regulator [Myxococcales bacterium]|nr:sigma 54-interacting transcriptional regulator [Myxococcales bacterium]